VRFGEEGHHRFVDALGGRGVDDFAKKCAAGVELMLEPQHGTGNRHRLRAGNANHTHAAAAGRSSDGDDGVVEVHSSEQRATGSWLAHVCYQRFCRYESYPAGF
jgi:hypothetical protein